MNLLAGPIPLLASLLAAAVLEEIVFRAGVQEALLWQLAGWPHARRAPAGVSFANLATALLFALVHGLLRSWALALPAFAASLWLGRVYERTRRLPPCIALHASLNLAWFLLAPWCISAIGRSCFR